MAGTLVHADEGQRTEVTLDAGGSLVATDWHPVWVEEVGGWVEIGSLTAGEHLYSAGGHPVVVKAVRHFEQQAPVYDLTVDSVHDYYVGAGAASVLVHNCGGSVTGHPDSCTCADGGAPKVRNGGLAGNTHPKTGVPFDQHGFPDFSAWRHPDVPDVRIPLTGSRGRDFALANKEAGLSSTPKGYTWHHHQDPGLMQLIETGIYRLTGHTGGFSG